MKNKVQKGDVIAFAAPFNVVGGQCITMGRLIGVAIHDALATQPVQCEMHGVFDLTKADANIAYTAGQLVYVTASGTMSHVDAAGANKLAGAAVEASGVGVTTVRVRLNGNVSLV